MEINTILQGDALKVLKTIPEESIDCVVTSPPYWGLRNYCIEGQLGLETRFEDYLKKLNAIFDEVRRVLKKTGTCWVNIGDTYCGSWGAQSHDLKHHARRANYNTRAPSSFHQSVPEKSLCLISFRFALMMLRRGWLLRNVIIWHKPNCMPSSVKDRFTVDFEYLFFITKNKRYWFETQYESDQGRASGNKKRFIANNNERSRLNTHMGSSVPWTPSPLGRNKRCVWEIPTQQLHLPHFATFPEELIEIPIKAGCPENGIVLDPFIGSGTTAVVALKLKRKFIGIELNPQYIEISLSRLQHLNQNLREDVLKSNMLNIQLNKFKDEDD